MAKNKDWSLVSQFEPVQLVKTEEPKTEPAKPQKTIFDAQKVATPTQHVPVEEPVRKAMPAKRGAKPKKEAKTRRFTMLITPSQYDKVEKLVLDGKYGSVNEIMNLAIERFLYGEEK